MPSRATLKVESILLPQNGILFHETTTTLRCNVVWRRASADHPERGDFFGSSHPMCRRTNRRYTAWRYWMLYVVYVGRSFVCSARRYTDTAGLQDSVVAIFAAASR